MNHSLKLYTNWYPVLTLEPAGILNLHEYDKYMYWSPRTFTNQSQLSSKHFSKIICIAESYNSESREATKDWFKLVLNSREVVGM